MISTSRTSDFQISGSAISSHKNIHEGLRQELGNKQAEVDYLKSKLFDSSSEKLKSPFPGQMKLFEGKR